MKKSISVLVLLSLIIITISCGGGGGSNGSGDLYPPAKPTDLQVRELDETSVTIEWTDNADNESGFVVERSVNGGEFELVVTLESDEDEFTEALPDDTIYEYRIQSYNSAGDSSYSNTTSVKRPKAAEVEITASEGGTISLSGIATITFPAGAVSSDLDITAFEGVKEGSVSENQEPYLDLISDIKPLNVIDFSESGVELKTSVRVVMNYDPVMLAEHNSSVQSDCAEFLAQGVMTQTDVDKYKIAVTDLDIYFFNVVTNRWVKTNATLDTGNSTLTVRTMYTGIYCVGYNFGEKSGHSIESDPELADAMLESLSEVDGEEIAENTKSYTCESCSKSTKSWSSSIPLWYSDSCTTCPASIDIGNVLYTIIPGTDIPAKCDNCSTLPGYNADRLNDYKFTKASAKHDCCYRYGKTTYGTSSDMCDVILIGDMYDKCRDSYPLGRWKKYKVFGHTIKIWIPYPNNIVKRAKCMISAGVLTAAESNIAHPGDTLVSYIYQPCFDYRNRGVDCRRPYIRKIDASSKSCEPREIITFTPDIYNPDNRNLTYSWSASNGTIDNPSAGNIVWTAPVSVGDDTEVTVTLAITDGPNIIPSKSIIVRVLKPYTLTYNRNGAVSGIVPESVAHIHYGDAVTVSGNTGSLLLTGYNFGGWNTLADGSGLDRPGGSFFIMGKRDVELFAKWCDESVIYNGNGNTGGIAPKDPNVYQVGDSVTVLDNTGSLTKGSDLFYCWNTLVDGTGINYYPGDVFSLTATNITLYAKWTWTRLSGVSGTWTRGRAVSVDIDGNVYITGETGGNLDGVPLTGSSDVLVIKYNSFGVKQWTCLSGVNGVRTYGSGISVDTDGNVYITGETGGNLDGVPLTGSSDAFVIKYNSSGVKQWTCLSGVNGTSTSGSGISVDTDGNVYITGETYGDLDGEPKTGIGDTFVIKYNSSGVKQWTRLSGVNGVRTYGLGISVDTDGNTYLTGYTYGNLDGQPLTGRNDAFVVKYDSLGNKQWTSLSGVVGVETYGFDISVDTDGDIYVTGQTGGNLDGQTLTGTVDAFVMKYDTSGNKEWTSLSGVSRAGTYGRGIVVNSPNNIYVTGLTTGGLDGQGRIGNQDTFVMKYDSSGRKLWTRLAGAVGATSYGYGISIDSAGTTYVTGQTSGNFDGQTLTGTSDAFVTTKLNQ